MDYNKGNEAYKEALRKAETYYYKGGEGYQTLLSSIFPELKESEDERIRKELIEFLVGKRIISNDLEGINVDKALIWLEKQGENTTTLPKWKYKKDNAPLLRDSIILNKYGCVAKSPSGALVSDVWVLDYDELAKLPKEEIEKQDEQNPVDKVEPKFKVGAWVVHNISKKIFLIKSTNSGYYTLEDIKGNIMSPCLFPDETEFHLWTLQDANDGDVLAFDDDTIVLFKDLYNKTSFHSYCHIEDGVFTASEKGVPDWWQGQGFEPATKEQRNLLFQKMKEAGYEWDAEKKELKKIGQKPNYCCHEVDLSNCSEEYRKAYYDGWNNCNQQHSQLKTEQKPAAWSEDDEKCYNSIIEHLKYSITNGKPETYRSGHLTNWLKFLKDRVKSQATQ